MRGANLPAPIMARSAICVSIIITGGRCIGRRRFVITEERQGVSHFHRPYISSTLLKAPSPQPPRWGLTRANVWPNSDSGIEYDASRTRTGRRGS
jgi:hypothetical protein